MHDAVEAFNQGVFFTQEHRYEHAVEAFTEAIELDSRMALAYNSRGVVRALLGDPEKGIADCSQAILLKPGDAVFHRSRGLVYREMGDEPNAEADLARAEELGYAPKD